MQSSIKTIKIFYIEMHLFRSIEYMFHAAILYYIHNEIGYLVVVILYFTS